MIGAVIGGGVTIAVSIIVQAYHLGSRLQALELGIEQNSADIKELNNQVMNHLQTQIKANQEAIENLEKKLD